MTESSSAPWLAWLCAHKGESEMTGQAPSTFIEDCFKHTNFGPLNGKTPPSCAATLCAALEKNGFKSTHRADAISFATFGEACELKPGAIVVFELVPGEHHVSCCEKILNATFVQCTGGNQGHEIKASTFHRQKIIAIRWPIEKL